MDLCYSKLDCSKVNCTYHTQIRRIHYRIPGICSQPDLSWFPALILPCSVSPLIKWRWMCPCFWIAVRVKWRHAVETCVCHLGAWSLAVKDAATPVAASLFPHPSLPPCTMLSLVPSVLAFSRLPLWGGTGWPAALEPHLTSFLRFQSTYQSLEKDASIPVLGHMPTPRLMTLFITLRYSDQSGLCVHSWDREDGGTWLITCRLVQRLFLIGRELSARIRIKGC